MLKDLQHRFLAQILGDKEQNFQQKIVKQGEISNDFRLQIYSNAYHSRLRECIETDHEVLGIYLGDDWFEQMVRGYIQKNPSNYTSLRHFADKLPEYLRLNEPFSDHPLIHELALFERTLLAAFDAKDTTAANREDLIALPPDRWPGLIMKLHPSARIMTTRYNTIEIWQALKMHIAGQDVDIPHAIETVETDWLIWRNQDRLTEFKSLNQAEHSLVSTLLAEQPFAEVCQLMATYYPPADLEVQILDHIYDLLDKQLIEFG